MQKEQWALRHGVFGLLLPSGEKRQAKQTAAGSHAGVHQAPERESIRGAGKGSAYGRKMHHRAKLTSEQVNIIRDMREERPSIWSYRALAEYAREQWGVECGESTVRDIVQYRTRAYE